MATKDFHNKPFDAGTLTKLRIFELYAQEWIPVFLSQSQPKFQEAHIFDFFSGPGTDSTGTYGSPLRTLNQLLSYREKGLAGWHKIQVVVHFFDENSGKIAQLCSSLDQPEWKIPGVLIDCRPISFQKALDAHKSLMSI